MWSKAQAGADTHSSKTTHSMVWRRAKQGGKRMSSNMAEILGTLGENYQYSSVHLLLNTTALDLKPGNMI